MAGEDTQILSNGNVEALTIIPPKMANGNGLICGKQHNNNGSIPNGNLHGIGGAENGKLIVPDEKSNSLHTEFDDADVSCGWGPCRPHWLQYFATKQAFLVTFCITWVSTLAINRGVLFQFPRVGSRSKGGVRSLSL